MNKKEEKTIDRNFSYTKLDASTSHEFCYNFMINNWKTIPRTTCFVINILKSKKDELANKVLDLLGGELFIDKRYIFDDDNNEVEEIYPTVLIPSDKLEGLVLFNSLTPTQNLTMEWSTPYYMSYGEDEKEKSDYDLYEVYIYSKTVDNDIFSEIKKVVLSFNNDKESHKDKISILKIVNERITTQSLDVPNLHVDLDAYYNDSLKPIDELVIDKLTNGKNSLFLFHGVSGGGKSSYIRSIMNRVDKEFVFLPPNLTEDLTTPKFLDFLLKKKNIVLVLEDGENVLHERVSGTSQAMANLLNVTDGILGSVLGISVICTFNLPISKIDPALQRKGRLTARYEFEKLNINKAKALYASLKEGNDPTLITEDLALADIFNFDSNSYKKEIKKIGFK